MRKLLFAAVFLFVTMQIQAQVTVTVVGTDGTSHEVAMDETGEIYFGTDYMAIMTSSSDAALQMFQMDDVRKVLFSGEVRIVDVRDADSIVLHPNPAADWFVVEGIGLEKQLLTVFSVSGSQVLQGRYAEGEHVDVSALPQGIYMVRVGTVVNKLVKR